MSSRWPTRNYLRIVLVALAGGFALAVPARAMSVIPPTFPELVQLADQIVRVEITEVGSRFDSAAGNSPIHTYVKCRVLKTLKGGAQETITLRLLGGWAMFGWRFPTCRRSWPGINTSFLSRRTERPSARWWA